VKFSFTLRIECIAFRGIYQLSRQNSTGVELIGDAVFARITDLKYIEKIGKICLRNQLQLLSTNTVAYYYFLFVYVFQRFK